ncbi:MAG TPA: lysylphosphatidylglycerol synthase transmembrane domain-containing protein, partial [Gemmatimonadota bacterium]|nr:lysylphosphatidylglycerol synthase transmembrane domain-containing protein [Gemmatimonadota bacterium]
DRAPGRDVAAPCACRATPGRLVSDPSPVGGHPWLRWAERIAALAVILFLAWYLLRNWSELSAHPWTVDWPRLALATLCVLAAYSGFVLCWRRILSRLGGRLSAVDAHRIWYIGNLGRYVPGKLLQLAGTAYLARAKGVSPVLSVSASLTSQVFVLAAGLVVAAATLPELGAGAAELTVLWPIGLGVAALLLVVVLTPILDVAYRLALRLVRRSEYHETVPAGERLVLLAANLLAWGAFGTGFWLFVRAVAPIEADTLLPMIGISAAGYVGGYLAIFVPGGLGVREGLYALLLAAYVPPSMAVAIAVFCRLWLTACELLPVSLLIGRYGLADLRSAAPDPSPRAAHG